MLAPGGYYLLERTNDATVSDIPADLTYTGSLRNEGETLELLDPSGAWVDRANAAGGAWPAGDRATRASMQRSGAEDTWDTYRGCGGNGVDAGGAPIQGTPRQANALDCVPPTPTGTATPTLTPSPASFPEGAVRINEIAWAGTHASASDEWIELFNPSPQEFDLAGWRLADGGDIDIPLSGVLPSGGFFCSSARTIRRSPTSRPMRSTPAPSATTASTSNCSIPAALWSMRPIGRAAHGRQETTSHMPAWSARRAAAGGHSPATSATAATLAATASPARHANRTRCSSPPPAQPGSPAKW